MLIILGLLCLGTIIGYLFRDTNYFKKADQTISYTIFVMLFIFGITIGANKSILNNIGTFGMQAALIAVLGILGSAIASYFAYKLYQKNAKENEN